MSRWDVPTYEIGQWVRLLKPMRYGQGDTWSIDAGSIGWVDYVDAVTGKVSIHAHGFNGEYVWGTMDPEDLEPGEQPKFTTMTLAHRWDVVAEPTFSGKLVGHADDIIFNFDFEDGTYWVEGPGTSIPQNHPSEFRVSSVGTWEYRHLGNIVPWGQLIAATDTPELNEAYQTWRLSKQASLWEEVPEFNVGDRVRVHSKSIGSSYNLVRVGDGTIIQAINLPGTRGWRLAVNQIQAPPAGVDPSPDDTIYELEIRGSISYFLEKDFDKVVESSLKLSWDIVSDELRIPYHSGELVFNFDTMTYYNTELHQSGEPSSENPWKFRHTSGGDWEANSKVDPNHWDPLISSIGMRLTEHMFGNDHYLHEASLKLSWEEEPQVGSYVKIIATPEDMEAIGLGYHSWDTIGTTGIVTHVSHGNVVVDAYLYPLDEWQRYMEVVPAPEVPTESSLKLSWEEVPEELKVGDVVKILVSKPVDVLSDWGISGEFGTVKILPAPANLNWIYVVSYPDGQSWGGNFQMEDIELISRPGQLPNEAE